MTAGSTYRIQQQHIAMARKRQRRRVQQTAAASAMADGRGQPPAGAGDGVTVNIRQIGNSDEGVLYTHRITERRGHKPRSTFPNLFRRDRGDDGSSVGSLRSFGEPASPRSLNVTVTPSPGRRAIVGSTQPATPQSPPPESDTLMGFRTFFGKDQKQYTIASKKKYRSNVLNWFDKHHMNFIKYFWRRNEVDNNVYRPSAFMYRYLDWTFTASYTGVFVSFLFIYMVLCLAFGGLLMLAGNREPNCIVATGEPFGARGDSHAAWSDAFALSWTTFTTVGYGMTYTSTASDFKDTEPHECSWVVFLCTSEAFLGLLFAGMCAAILFGKVNRIQSHAKLIFCNAVCLQYEEMDDEYNEPILADSERSDVPLPELEDEENGLAVDTLQPHQEENKFVDQFNGCPILKFQVVNELCNREGGELVDCIMKVVGIKFKGPNGKVTHSQYVRVNLVDFEHPFLSRVWHGVHVLDATSPLLTERARQRIKANAGSWPCHWFDPEVIRSKLEFHDLIVTVAGISNVSAVTVHAYKRYKIGDVLIGYNFAPIVFRDPETGALDVELSMCHDVREQDGIRGEDLSMRRVERADIGPGGMDRNRQTSIRIKRSKSGDYLESEASHHSGSTSRPSSGFGIFSSSNSITGITLKSTQQTNTSPLEMAEPDTSEDDISTRHLVSPNGTNDDVSIRHVVSTNENPKEV